MNTSIITVDLGTTNIKVGIYSSEMEEQYICSIKVVYITEDKYVEFDPEAYWDLFKQGIHKALKECNIDPARVIALSLTGQAESLILIDSKGNPLRNGISWMDSRSENECKILKETFNIQQGYNITGIPDIIPTWPITKMLWIKRKERDLFKRVYKYLLLKDYIIFRLTGKFLSEYTVYNFSYYFDIIRKKYWSEILDFIGINEIQLPELTEPGKDAGSLTNHASDELHLPREVKVNTGALDHFAGMIGSGNIKKGILGETTGTVLAIATMVDRPMMNEYNIACHYNAVEDTYVLLPVCESGGVSLEWFKSCFYPKETFNYLSEEIGKVLNDKNEIIFLPYLTGANAPEFNINARGVFYGLNITHTKIDFARAVMEGVAYLLKKNIKVLEKIKIKVSDVISLGGGSKSTVWNQIKSDITGKNIVIPEYKEATSLGAAILAGIQCGFCNNVGEAVDKYVKIKKIYSPINSGLYTEGYKKFLEIYKRLTPLFNDDYSCK